MRGWTQFQFAPATEKVPVQYDGTEQINSIAVLQVLLGLAIFCAMYLWYVFCVWTLYTVGHKKRDTFIFVIFSLEMLSVQLYDFDLYQGA